MFLDDVVDAVAAAAVVVVPVFAKHDNP